MGRRKGLPGRPGAAENTANTHPLVSEACVSFLITPSKMDPGGLGERPLLSPKSALGKPPQASWSWGLITCGCRLDLSGCTSFHLGLGPTKNPCPCLSSAPRTAHPLLALQGHV